MIKKWWHNENIILFIFISIYLFLELINIKLPGLYADEAFPACGAMQMIRSKGYFMPSFRIFNINFPLMLAPYETALESYLLLPFLWGDNMNVIMLRLLPISMGALMIIFMYFFLKEFLNKEVAWLSIVLLIFNSGFLLETKLGLNSASMLHFTGIGALWSLFRWYKGKSDKYFYLGIFLLGIGISIRVWFLWYVNAMMILALIFNRELRERMGKDIRKYSIISFLLFLISNSLFVFYSLTSQFGTIKYIFEHFAKTQCSVNNAHYFFNLKMRIQDFIGWLESKSPLLGQGGWYKRTPLNEISINPLSPYIFMISFVWLLFVSVANKTYFSRKRIIFILILFTFILLQSPFTLSALTGPHLFILYPLIQIIEGMAFIDMLTFFKKSNVIFISVSVSCILISFLLLESNVTLNNNYLYFKRTGGTGNNSDAIFSLVNYLKSNKIYKPIVMDWGISHNLVFLSEGRINPVAPDYVEGGHSKEAFIAQCIQSLKDNNTYIYHSLSFSNRPEIHSIFNELVTNRGKVLYQEKVFYQRDGYPVYVVYSVR